MDNLLSLLNLFNQVSHPKEEIKQDIPKEILDQYPYGEFPIKYTKVGQEKIRKDSENRYSYLETEEKIDNHDKNNNLEIAQLLPLIQLLSNKNNSVDTFKILGKFLFKDNKEIQDLFCLLSPNKIKAQELEKNNEFPNTNKVDISSLKRIT